MVLSAAPDHKEEPKDTPPLSLDAFQPRWRVNKQIAAESACSDFQSWKWSSAEEPVRASDSGEDPPLCRSSFFYSHEE